MKPFLLALLMLVSSIGLSAVPIDEKYALPNVSYVYAGSDVLTSTGASVQVLSRNSSFGKTFYIDSLIMEAAPTVISATGVHMGTCSLQVPAGTTVMTFNFNNSTASQIDRQVIQPSHPIAVPSSFAVSCFPASTTAEYWNINYVGFETQ